MAIDPLEEAVGALRDETAGPTGRESDTLTRILEDARPAGRASGVWRRRAFVLPLVAALLAVGAISGAAERAFDWARERLFGASSDVATPALHASAPVRDPEGARAASSAPVATATGEPSSAPAVSSSPSASAHVERPGPVVAVSRPRSSHDAPAPSVSAVRPPSSASAALEGDEELYRRAHRSHFAGNYGAALTLWDEYLARSQTRTHAPEARYLRAVCLFRLGRTSEARAAFAPFVRGEYGPYYQREAKRVLGDASEGP